MLKINFSVGLPMGIGGNSLKLLYPNNGYILQKKKKIIALLYTVIIKKIFFNGMKKMHKNDNIYIKN